MSDRLYIMTFENGVDATSPTALIPVDLIESRVIPFLQNRRATDGREIEFDLLFWGKPGFGRSAQQEAVEMSVTLNDDDEAYATGVCITGWSDNEALADIVLTMLQSANAVLVLDSDTPPVVGRIETIAHLPTDLIATLGPAYVAESPDMIFGDGAAATEQRTPPINCVSYHPDQIAYWRQLQVVEMQRERVHLFAGQAVVLVSSIVERAQAESEPSDSIAQLRDYLALADGERDETCDLGDPIWQQRATAAHDAVVAFDLPGRVNGGCIKTRFGEYLLEVDIARYNRTGCLEEAGDADAQARLLEAVVAEQGLSTAQPAPAASLPPAALDDAALIAAHQLQVEDLLRVRREVWSHLKSLTDMFPRDPQWMTGFGSDDDGLLIVASMLHRLERLRTEARADRAPNWNERVEAALAAVDPPSTVQAMLARPFAHGPDYALMAVARALEFQIQRPLREAAEVETRLVGLTAELDRRGLTTAAGRN